MKKNVEEGMLGDERYQLVAFAISGLILFLSEIRVISLEAANAFKEYEHDRIHLFGIILVETILSHNHYKMHGKGAVGCYVLMSYLWIISHIKTPKGYFQ
jgi:hypothetical protein